MAIAISFQMFILVTVVVTVENIQLLTSLVMPDSLLERKEALIQSLALNESSRNLE